MKNANDEAWNDALFISSLPNDLVPGGVRPSQWDPTRVVSIWLRLESSDHERYGQAFAARLSILQPDLFETDEPADDRLDILSPAAASFMHMLVDAATADIALRIQVNDQKYRLAERFATLCIEQLVLEGNPQQAQLESPDQSPLPLTRISAEGGVITYRIDDPLDRTIDMLATKEWTYNGVFVPVP